MVACGGTMLARSATMTDVFVNDRPLDQFGNGFVVTMPFAGWIDAPGRELVRVPAPRRAGQWVTATQSGIRSLTITVEPTLSGVSARRAAVAGLYRDLQGMLDIRLADDPLRYCRALLTRGVGTTYGPAMAVPDTSVELHFEAQDPHYYATVPTMLTVPVSTRVTVIGGTAPHGGVLDIYGVATDPVTVIQRDRAGNELARLTITAAWANTQVVRCDFDWGTVKRYTGATVLDFEDEISATEVPFTFDPGDSPHTLEYTGAASALYTFRKADLA